MMISSDKAHLLKKKNQKTIADSNTVHRTTNSVDAKHQS